MNRLPYKSAGAPVVDLVLGFVSVVTKASDGPFLWTINHSIIN